VPHIDPNIIQAIKAMRIIIENTGVWIQESEREHRRLAEAHLAEMEYR
jgi:hypothetical protein